MYDESRQSFNDWRIQQRQYPISVVICDIACICSMAYLCEKTSNGAQNVGDGRRLAVPSTLPAKMLIVCHKNESFRPCRNIASMVAHNDCVWSHRSNCSTVDSARKERGERWAWSKNQNLKQATQVKLTSNGIRTHAILQLILNLFRIIRKCFD